MRRAVVIAALVCLCAPAPTLAQRGQRGGGPAQTAREAAPMDLTGYWVTVIIADWRNRMITPAKGDYLAVPITAAAQKIADAWDPAKDEAAGLQCKSYGAPAIMAMPTRLHITWQDDATLKVETDYGTQTRLLRFGDQKPAAGPPSWQGDSQAVWEFGGRGGGGRGPRSGSLKITTSRVRPGYLRKNGVPYSANIKMTEFWDVITDPKGTPRLMVTQQLEDPEYLFRTWITTYNFKKEPDGSKWDPSPCSSRW